MRGFKSNAVQELKRILKDQYSPHSIIKELIQNSDDAKSSRLHIGWIPKAPPNTHPLLNSSAIVVLNNGEFKPHDAKAICQLNVGSKGGDESAIGKFGLGMKSIFHLCESFFYL